jgi:hypothetical protein
MVQMGGTLCMLTFLSQTGRLQAEVVQEHRVFVRGGHRDVAAGGLHRCIPRGRKAATILEQDASAVPQPMTIDRLACFSLS